MSSKPVRGVPTASSLRQCQSPFSSEPPPGVPGVQLGDDHAVHAEHARMPFDRRPVDAPTDVLCRAPVELERLRGIQDSTLLAHNGHRLGDSDRLAVHTLEHANDIPGRGGLHGPPQHGLSERAGADSNLAPVSRRGTAAERTDDAEKHQVVHRSPLGPAVFDSSGARTRAPPHLGPAVSGRCSARQSATGTQTMGFSALAETPVLGGAEDGRAYR
jgi:hypothetical protein